MYSPAKPIIHSSKVHIVEDGPLALLRTVADVLSRQRYKIALWVATCMGLALLQAMAMPPVYTAVAMMLLEPRQGVANRESGVAPTTLDLSRTDSELQILRSERLLAQVFDSLDLVNQPDLRSGPAPAAAVAGGAEAAAANEAVKKRAFAQFSRRLNARRVGQSYVIEVSYASADPMLPARIVNSAISAYLLQSISFKAEASKSGAEIVQGRLDSLSEQAASAAAAMKLGAVPDIPTPDADARVIGAALQPLGAEGPRRSLIVALGGLFGLLSAIFVGAVGSFLDKRLYTPEQVVRETGLAFLAKLPDPNRPGAQPATMAHPDSSFAFAVRDLRTSIKIACEKDHTAGNHVMAFVAWEPEANTSRLCMSIARLFSGAGRNAVVIDADVIGSAKGRPAAAADTPTLSDMLTSTAALQDVLFTDSDGVLLLPARGPRSKPSFSVDFHNRKIFDILKAGKEQGDVLLNLPPLSLSADAKVLARQADAVVIAIRPGKTSVEDVRSCVAMLEDAGAVVTGAVFVPATNWN